MDGRDFQPDEQTSRAREFRQTAIKAEDKLWRKFRASNIDDLKIRRQHPIGPFIVDFYCFPARLALEIDGSSHNDQEVRDAARDKYLAKMGVETIRVSPCVADEIISEFVNWFREQCRERANQLNK